MDQLLKSEDDLVSACLSDCEALRDLVATMSSPKCLEVGAYIGWTALAMVQGGADVVFSVDLWSGDLHKEEGWKVPWVIDPKLGQNVLSQYCERVPIFTKVFPVVGDSLFWAKRWPFPLDLIFIDGAHNYEAVSKDIAAWSPLVKQGGCLCGHDYTPLCPGVIQAVQETGPFEVIGASVWLRRM